MTVELGSLYCYQRSGTKSRLIEKKETFQYIPLIENLQCVLQNKEIYSEVSHIPKPYLNHIAPKCLLCIGYLYMLFLMQAKYCTAMAMV